MEVSAQMCLHGGVHGRRCLFMCRGSDYAFVKMMLRWLSPNLLVTTFIGDVAMFSTLLYFTHLKES